MKKMQKEMKDVELQLGIVANQVKYSIHFVAQVHVVYQLCSGFAARQNAPRETSKRG